MTMTITTKTAMITMMKVAGGDADNGGSDNDADDERDTGEGDDANNSDGLPLWECSATEPSSGSVMNWGALSLTSMGMTETVA